VNPSLPDVKLNRGWVGMQSQLDELHKAHEKLKTEFADSKKVCEELFDLLEEKVSAFVGGAMPCH
jgi:chaperonin cofactor prefoldin